MNRRRISAICVRLLREVRRDHRTLAMVVAVPAVLVTLLRYVYNGQPDVFDRMAPALIGVFPLVSMFLVTSIAMLRERTSGTLERLMASPVGRLELLAGYGLAFGLLASIQAVVTVAVAFWGLGVTVAGPVWLVALLAVAVALLGMSLGLFLSAFARSEFQAVQFMPAVILPQLLLCGLFVPRDQMAAILEWIALAMPFSYAFDALMHAAGDGSWTSDFAWDVSALSGAVLLAVVGGALTLRRRTP